MIGNLDHIMIRVNNLDEAIKFYEETLSLNVIWEFENYVGFSNGIVIHDSTDTENLSVFFKVDSVERVVKSLKEQGITVLMGPTPVPTGYTAVFEDNSKNKIHIVDNINIS